MLPDLISGHQNFLPPDPQALVCSMHVDYALHNNTQSLLHRKTPL